eukprot:2982700-Prymnesium_polylepis.1
MDERGLGGSPASFEAGAIRTEPRLWKPMSPLRTNYSKDHPTLTHSTRRPRQSPPHKAPLST